MKSVPAQASASVAYNIDTHMTHRAGIYEFPVPWCNINWGVRGEHLDDPAKVQYLVLDRRLISDPPRQGAALGPSVRRVRDRVRAIRAVAGGQASSPAGASARRPNPPEGQCFARPSLNRFQPDLNLPAERDCSAAWMAGGSPTC